MRLKQLQRAAICAGLMGCAANAAINITVVGDGSGYEETGLVAFRSTSVGKSFDADGNDEYGSAGTFFFGNNAGAGNGLGWSEHTQTGAEWATFAQGAQFSSVSEQAAYGPYDDPTLSGTDVADWALAGIGVALGSGVGAWAEVLTFTIDSTTPQQFRVGIMSGTQTTSSDGRWDPTGLRLSVDGGAPAEITGLPNTPDNTSGWAFFDVDLNGETSGTFSLEGQNRLAGQGTAISGVTFDVNPEAAAGMLVGYDFNSDAADMSDATVVAANMTASPLTSPMAIAFVSTVGDNSGEDAAGSAFGGTGTVGCVGIGVDDAVTGSFEDAVAGNDYISFTVTPDAGAVFQLSSITFKVTKKHVDSVDEYAVTDASGNLIGSSVIITNVVGLTGTYDGVVVDLSGTALETMTEATQFRIYAWGRGTTSTSSTLAALDKITLYGRAIAGVPPGVDNLSGVSNLLADAATLTGTLVSTGAASTQVWAYWGETDGGTNVGAWAHNADLGMLSPGDFSVQVDNLTTDTEYVYRCAASNQYGTVWSGLQSFTPSYPRISVDPAQMVEGDSGSSLAVFRVWLSRAYPEAISFTFSTADGLAGSADYEAQGDTLTFLPGETQMQIAITIWGDALDEGDEDFYFAIDSAEGAVIESGTARGVIFSDDRDFYLSPTELAADAVNGLLYIAESTAARVGVVDLANNTRLGSIDLPQHPSGLALSSDGATLYVTAGVSDGAVYVVDTASMQVTQTIPVGHTPRSPVLATGNRLYICERFLNTVAVVDLTTGSVADRIGVLREPFDAALTPDGSKLVVGNLLPHQPSTQTGVAASVSVIDTASGLVTASIVLPPGSHSLRDVAVSPDGGYAVVAHALGRYRVPANQIFRGWVNTSTLSIIDLASDTLYNTVELDDLDLGAANPWGTGFTADGGTLCIAHAGTHELSAVDWPGLLAKLSSATKNVCDDLSYLAGLRRRLPLPGNGPRDVAVVGTTVYAANYFSDSLSVADLADGQEYAAQEIEIGWVMPQTDVRLGMQLFHDATLSAQQWQSCTSCHPGGRNDGLNWDLLNDGFGNAKNAKSLLQAHYTAPTTWTGVRPNAETSVRAGIMFSHMIKWKNNEDLYLDAFLKAQQPVPSPYLVDGGLSAAAVRGETIFNARCTGCHSGDYLTDQELHDVGTGTTIDAGPFDTPSLIEVWRTGPYLHDGRAQTIRDVLEVFSHGSTAGLTETQIDDLVEYIKSL
ncbi:Antigen Lp49 [Pontiella desulfatans]|uniref:Antigen Lp49 n=1 Tax=Pontiella desulfatans TaxID=2750659 RepID=A0A6C2TZR8_PONDE|nr:cytochrome c peroxidase [Pontiella desulfatans]VGO13218.1 Antigen Lp49 [Pontiella desulfatans]